MRTSYRCVSSFRAREHSYGKNGWSQNHHFWLFQNFVIIESQAIVQVDNLRFEWILCHNHHNNPNNAFLVTSWGFGYFFEKWIFLKVEPHEQPPGERVILPGRNKCFSNNFFQNLKKCQKSNPQPSKPLLTTFAPKTRLAWQISVTRNFEIFWWVRAFGTKNWGFG